MHPVIRRRHKHPFVPAQLRQVLGVHPELVDQADGCLLYTSDAADERSSVDLGGRRIIKKKKNEETGDSRPIYEPSPTAIHLQDMQ